MQLRNKSEVSACEVELEVEVGAEEVERAIDGAYREFSKVTEVPGFRKGKAPRQILARYISEVRVKERAAEALLPKALVDAVEEAGLEPFAQPEIEIVEFEDRSPLIFKVNVPLTPKVELADYVGIEVERLVPVVTDEQIESEIDELRERTATFEQVEDRPVQKFDMVLVRIVDESKPDEQPETTTITVGENLPSFDEGLEGMSVGEEKVINLVYPEDFKNEELAGKTASIHTSVLEIREKKLPEPDDAWSKTVGAKLRNEIDSIDQLRKKIRAELEKTAIESADKQVEWRIVMHIVENSNICYPDIMREEEMAHRLKNMAGELERLDSSLEDYLARTGKTKEQLMEGLEKSVDRELKVMLVLSDIAQKENIKVEEEEIEQEIQRQADERGVPVESFRAYVDKTETREGFTEGFFKRKILDFLVRASNIKNVGQAS